MLSPGIDLANLSEKLQLLWAGVRAKDYSSLTDLYRLMYSDLLNFGLLFSHDAASAKDAINQIFLEVWEKGEALMPVDNVRSYLITYLRRKLLREYERGNRFTDLPDNEPLSDRSYEDIIVHAQQEEQTRQRLKQALDQLTPRQKELIELRFFRALSNEAISQQTGLHINTVYNTMSSALKTLRLVLGDETYYNFSGWWPFLFPLLLTGSGLMR